MADRKKVISEFEDFVKSFSKRDDTYYKGLFVSVLALLKEQAEQLAMMRMIYGTDAKIVGEIVRCKDCRHCTFSDGEQLADCMIKQGWFPVKPEWFCADGERRTDDA